MTMYRTPELGSFDWQQAVIDKDLTAPPGSPSEGDRYIVGPSATGDWAGQDDKIAWYYNSAWNFDTPAEGWKTWVKDEDTTYQYTGSAWESTPDVDEKAKVSANDTTTGYLEDKIVGTANKISVTVLNEGGNEQLKIDKGSDIFDKAVDDLDDVPDGTSYQRVAASEVDASGYVTQINDGTNVVTAAQAKVAYDRRAQYNAALGAITFEI